MNRRIYDYNSPIDPCPFCGVTSFYTNSAPTSMEKQNGSQDVRDIRRTVDSQINAHRALAPRAQRDLLLTRAPADHLCRGCHRLISRSIRSTEADKFRMAMDIAHHRQSVLLDQYKKMHQLHLEDLETRRARLQGRTFWLQLPRCHWKPLQVVHFRELPGLTGTEIGSCLSGCQSVSGGPERSSTGVGDYSLRTENFI